MTVGYTTGVFDMFHVGHLRILEQARGRCDRLIVGVTTDELSLSVKGKPPIIDFQERVDIVGALRCVDLAIPQTTMDKFSAWDQLRFDRMFVGDDWQGTDKWNVFERDFASRGVEIIYFAYTRHTSSTMLRSALEIIHGVEE